jgi:hypothetical protein
MQIGLGMFSLCIRLERAPHKRTDVVTLISDNQIRLYEISVDSMVSAQ